MSEQNTHIFSQSGELSQLTCGFSKEKDSLNNCDYDLQESEALQNQDETLSSRAEAICKENRQINRFVESSFKQLDKKRIKLINKEKSIDETKKRLLETHERQSQQILDLQMNLEEWSGVYQNKLNDRSKLVKKLEQLEDFTKFFEHHLTQGLGVGDSIEDMKKFMQAEREKIQKKDKAIQEKEIEMKSSCVARMSSTAKNCKACNEDIIKERENSVGVIQSLVFQNEEMSRSLCNVQQEIEKYTQVLKDRTQSYNEISVENKVLNESIAKIQQELNESRAVNASRVQHLKLQINSVENNNTNQEFKYQEKEDHINSLTTKFKESFNLSNQLKMAIEETKKNIDGQAKEIELCKFKKAVLNEQAYSLVENIKKYENIENENQSYKSMISTLEEDVKSNSKILSEKEDIANKLISQISDLEKTLHDLQDHKSQLDIDFKHEQAIENELISRVREDRIRYQQERENKMLQNATMEQNNIKLSSEIAAASRQYEELCKYNDEATDKVEELKVLIKSFNDNVQINERERINAEEEWNNELKNFEEEISSKNAMLEKCEYFIEEAIPHQKELAKLLEKKEYLEQEMKLLDENNQKKLEMLENNHKSKLQEMNNENEKFTSIMKSIVTAEQDTIDKLKEDIKKEEKIKTVVDDELRAQLQKLKALKNEEMPKRIKVARMEKRLATIVQEINVTRQDIADAVTGEVQEKVMFKKTRMSAPQSTAGSSYSLHGKISQNKENIKYMPQVAPNLSKQENTRKWVESVPDDDYEFSEV